METDKAVLRINHSKVRKDYNPWHDAPLPRSLETVDKDVPLETGDADDHPDEDKLGKESSIDYVDSYVSFVT